MTRSTKPEETDTTISDIHRTRRRISDAFGGDIHAITDDARKRQERSGRPTVSYAVETEKTTNPAGD
jgi:hypothetical protein